MVSQKFNLTKILIIIFAFIAFVFCTLPVRAEGPYLAEYEGVPIYFVKNVGTLTYTHENIYGSTTFCDASYDCYFFFYRTGNLVYGGAYCPDNTSVSCGYVFSSKFNNLTFQYKADLTSFQSVQDSKYLTVYDTLPNIDSLGLTSSEYKAIINSFVDSGEINKYKDAEIVDISLNRNDANFGLQNVNADCVDNSLTVSWSMPFSYPDNALSMPILVDLLIEDTATGESAIFFYPATESITERPAICDVSDLSFSFDVGNIKDIPEYFKIKSVSLTPYYVQHLEYLDMDVTYKGQTSHVFLNYVGHDEKPIYSAPVVQLPPDTEIIEQDMPTSIFGAITNFFSGFFNNFGTMLKNLFIPTKVQLTSLFSSLEAFFNDKLGFLWYPFDLAIQIVEALSQGEAKSTITFPGFTLPMDGGIQVWSDMEFEIDQVGIFPVVRTVTSIVLACSVAGLAYKKWDEWIGGTNTL